MSPTLKCKEENEDVRILEEELRTLKLENENQNAIIKEILRPENSHVDRADYYGDAKPDDVIRLNIRGTKTAVLRSTLTCVKGSMLAAKFSGRWDDSMEKDEGGNVIIDQDYAIFGPILRFLQNQNANDPSRLYRVDEKMKSNLDELLDYYGVAGIINPMTLKIVENLCNLESNIFGLEVKTKEKNVRNNKYGVVYQMSHPTKSFEVRFKKPFKAFNTIKFMKRATLPLLGIEFGKRWATCYEIPDNKICLRIDETRYASMTLDMNDYDIHNDHIVVRGEDFGRRWYINGKLLVWKEELQENIDNFFRKHSSSMRSFVPEIYNFGGEFEITSYECHFV